MSAAADPRAELAEAHAKRVRRGKRSVSARRPLPQGSDLPSVLESLDMEPHDDDDTVQHPQAGRSGGQEDSSSSEEEDEEKRRGMIKTNNRVERGNWQNQRDWQEPSVWNSWKDNGWRDWSDWEWPRDSGSGAASGEIPPEVVAWVALQEAEREEERARGATGPGPLEQPRDDREPLLRRPHSPVRCVAAHTAFLPQSRSGGLPAGPQPLAPPTRSPFQLPLWERPPPPEMAERQRERSPAAEVGQERAAVAAPLRAYDLRDFEARTVTASYRQHNSALKWFRSVAETTGQAVVCEETMQIGKIWKQPKRGPKQHNMDYIFLDGKTVSWSWLDMIAQMDQATMAHIVNGPEGSSGGLMRCEVAVRNNGYDHSRCYASKILGDDKRGQHQDAYDFVVHRKDLTAVRFHPEWSNKEFNVYAADPHRASPVLPPRTGCGGSDGSGTYQRYKDRDKAMEGKFDEDKGNGMPPGRLGYQ